MSKIKYSKKRLTSQARLKNFISKIIPVGTVLMVTDLMKGHYEDNDGNEVANDVILCQDPDGQILKLSVREFMKMTVKDGEHYQGESDNDDIFLPEKIEIVASEDRKGKGEDEPRYPTYAYNGAQEFIDSKGQLDYVETVIKSGLREDNPFDPLQNYTVVLS